MLIFVALCASGHALLHIGVKCCKTEEVLHLAWIRSYSRGLSVDDYCSISLYVELAKTLGISAVLNIRCTCTFVPKFTKQLHKNLITSKAKIGKVTKKCLKSNNSFCLIWLILFPFVLCVCIVFVLCFQALEASKREHSLTLRMVKEKIISTECV